MVNLTAAERVYEYWIDKASSAADLVLKIVFAVILFLVARKLILWLCGLIRKNMRRFHTEEAVVSFTVSMVKYSLNTLLVLTIIVRDHDGTVVDAVDCRIIHLNLLNRSLLTFARKNDVVTDLKWFQQQNHHAACKV